MNNENMSSGKGLTLVKTTLLSGQERVTVVASLPTNQSCDVTANIPILARITQTAVNVGAYFHVRVFKSYIYRQHNCFDRMSIRCNQNSFFLIKVVLVKLILFKL